MPAIEAISLAKTYDGDVAALTNLHLTIEAGEVFGLLGPNGAGKTKTVRLLNGTLEPTSGTAKVLVADASDLEIKQRTATLAELARLYEHMSAVKNLEFFASMYGVEKDGLASRIDDLIDRMGLRGREHDKVGTFSTGMKKRVQLARTLLHEPELIFLDEPTSGLDPDAAKQVTELVRKLAQEEGRTVVLSTHNLPMAETVCDTFGFLSEGTLIASGSKESLVAGVQDQLSVDVTTSAGTESIEIEDEKEINAQLKRIMDSGAHILEVKIDRPDLEALYFEYVGRSEHALG